MDKMIAICGLTCSDCPAFLATQKDDDEERKRVAEMWSKEYGADMKPEDINCDGCILTEGRHIAHCSTCEIRKCGLERGVENCGHCDDYACEKLGKFFEMAPAAKDTLDGVRKSL
jgi:hypothetical protein